MNQSMDNIELEETNKHLRSVNLYLESQVQSLTTEIAELRKQKDEFELKYAECSCENSGIYDWSLLAKEEIANLKKEVAELRKQLTWIPVSERLPDKTQKIIALCGDSYEITVGWRMYGISIYTHWLPIPEFNK